MGIKLSASVSGISKWRRMVFRSSCSLRLRSDIIAEVFKCSVENVYLYNKLSLSSSSLIAKSAHMATLATFPTKPTSLQGVLK